MTTAEAERRKTWPVSLRGQNATVAPLWRRFVTPGCFIVLGVVLFFAYLAEADKLPIFADGSSQALQAWDMLHGNLILHGWVLSDVSFYTTEIPQYMLIELVRGRSPDVVHIAAAMTYALLVVLAAVLAKGRATGREGVARALIAIGIMLAPPIGRIYHSRGFSPAWILLSAPDHTGTQVPLVLTWLVLDRAKRRWWVPVVVTALLTWVEIADSTAIFEGALPIAVVCAVRMYRRRGTLAGQWYDLSLAAGALASAGASTAALSLIASRGGFTVNPASPVLITIYGMNANFWVKVHSILTVFGADFFGQPAANAIIPLAHLAGLALAGWGVTRALRQFFSGDDLAMQVLTASFLLLLAEFMFGYRTGGRETVGLLPIGAVLAGRMLAAPVFTRRLAPALAALLACFGLSLASSVLSPALPSPDRPLASWLRSHDLAYGLSTSWYASNGVTLYSRGAVRVRDVKLASDGRLDRLRWNTKASWYGPGAPQARFLIFSPCRPTPLGPLIKAAGPPAASYLVDGFSVLVWHKNLLAVRPRTTRRTSPQATQLGTASGKGRLAQTRVGNRHSRSDELMCG